MYLFVYGTLRKTPSPRAISAHSKFLSDAIFCGIASVKGYLYSLGHYPGLLLDDDSPTSVKGEIYQISEKTLATLDEYEEIDPTKTNNEYHRIKKIITDGEGENFSVWIYAIARKPEGKELIESCDWCS